MAAFRAINTLFIRDWISVKRCQGTLRSKKGDFRGLSVLAFLLSFIIRTGTSKQLR